MRPERRPPSPPIRVAEPAKPSAGDKPAAERPALPADAAAAFAALAPEGVLADPKTLVEHYHNARAHEVRGERQQALRAYAAAAPLASDTFDVLLRYASLLRNAQGAEAARKTFQELDRAGSKRNVALVVATLAEGAARRARLETIASAEPEFAPAQYLLAEALTDRRQNGPTLTERRLAFAGFDRFIEAAETGAVASLFVDRALLDTWLDAARKRRSEIEAHFASAAVRPAVSFTRTDSGWTARLTLPEPATAVLTRLGEAGEFAPAGASTGKTQTSTEIAIPASVGRTTLYVTYRDLAGQEAGPFPVAFDPEAASASAGREALEKFPESWVTFRPDLPDLLSFALLASNRCAIRQALIGFGDEPPRRPLALPACEAGRHASAASGTRPLVTLPPGTDAVQIQLAYADGTESQVRTFRRP